MCATIHAATAETLDTFIVASSSSKALYEIATEISERLNRDHIHAALIDIDSSATDILKRADLIITVGNIVTQKVHAHRLGKPLIGIATRPLQSNGAFTQLLIQQPVCRQLALIQALSPDFSRVSIISNNDSLDEQIIRCEKKQKLDIQIIKPQKHETLNRVLARAFNSDVLLAIPDRTIYNHTTVKNILLQSYRKRIPVIGFSRSFVNAGALAAIHSRPEQIAKQVTELVLEFKHKGHLPTGMLTPSYFDVKINTRVSDSLQLDVPDAKTIVEELLKGDSK